MKESEFKASFDHLAHSLENAQATIRFVDKKIGSAMALLTAVLGFVVPKYVDVKMVFEAWQSCACGKVCSLAFGMTGCVCGILLLKVLYNVARAMSPRSPSGPWSGGRWLLFPFWNTPTEGADYDRVTKSKIAAKGISHEDILAEFQEQLCVLGGILGAKMEACTKMFRNLWLFFCAGAIFIVISLVTEWSAHFYSAPSDVLFHCERVEKSEINVLMK